MDIQVHTAYVLPDQTHILVVLFVFRHTQAYPNLLSHCMSFSSSLKYLEEHLS
jgi:hypothetical protein